jgi:phage/plasmid-associated DNA primase
VKDARTKYHDENNTVVAFFNDCMVERENGKVEDNCTTGRVYKMYRAWCNDNNHGYCKTASEFRDEIANYLNKPYAELVTRRGKGGSFYKDYTISDEAKENYRKTYDYDDFFPVS